MFNFLSNLYHGAQQTVGNFFHPQAPAPQQPQHSNLGQFLGSTLGNIEHGVANAVHPAPRPVIRSINGTPTYPNFTQPNPIARSQVAPIQIPHINMPAETVKQAAQGVSSDLYHGFVDPLLQGGRQLNTLSNAMGGKLYHNQAMTQAAKQAGPVNPLSFGTNALLTGLNFAPGAKPLAEGVEKLGPAVVKGVTKGVNDIANLYHGLGQAGAANMGAKLGLPTTQAGAIKQAVQAVSDIKNTIAARRLQHSSALEDINSNAKLPPEQRTAQIQAANDQANADIRQMQQHQATVQQHLLQLDPSGKSMPVAPGQHSGVPLGAQRLMDQQIAADNKPNLSTKIAQGIRTALGKDNAPTSNPKVKIPYLNNERGTANLGADMNPNTNEAAAAFAKDNGITQAKPAHQAQIEAALAKNDLGSIAKIIKSMAPADPYKQSMISLFKDRIPSLNESGAMNMGAKLKIRGLTTGVKGSDNFSPELQKAVQGEYSPFTNKAALAAQAKFAKQSLAKQNTQALTHLSSEAPIGKQEVVNYGKTMQALDAKGKTDQATAIHDLLAKKLTEAGQTGQAASLLYNRTPEGMQNAALRALRDAKVELTPELKAKINAGTAAVKAAKPGSEDLHNAQQNLIKTVSDRLPRTKGDAAFGIWRAGLISGPETMAKVISGYGVNAPFDALARPLAATTDAVVSHVPGIKFLHRNEPGYTPGARGITFNPITDTANAVKGAFRGAKAIPGEMRSGIGAQDTGGFPASMKKSTKMTGYEKVITRLHASIPKPAYGATYDVNIAEQARTAAINRGLKGADKQAFIDKLTKTPTQKMIDNATLEAQKATNANDTSFGTAASAVQGLKIGKFPVGKILAPITRVPSAIGAKGLAEVSPLGYGKAISEVAKGITKGKFDQRAFSLAMGKASTGTGIALLGAGLMKGGRLTLSAPSDPKEKALWQAEGKRPNSVYVGGKVTKASDGTLKYAGGNWVSLNATGALGITGALGGGYEKSLEAGQGPGGATVGAALAGGKLIADQPYLKGPSGFAAALSNPAQSGQTFLDSTVGSVIPGFSAQTAKGIDSNQRTATTGITDTLAAKIPGLAQSRPAQLGPYGENLPGANPNGTFLGGLLGSINPWYPSPPANQSDPATQEVQRLYNLQGKQGPDISAATTIHGQPVKSYTGQQVQQFIADSGPVIQKGINNLVQNPQYLSLSDAQKTTAINSAVNAARQATAITSGIGDYLPSGKGSQDILSAIANYAKAFMTSPGAAFNDIFHGQTIIGTAGGGILVQRAGVSSTNALINSRGGAKQNGVPLQLDHKIPLEVGGTNAVSNLQLITKAQDDANNVAENFLGSQLKSGKVNMGTAQQLILDYKAGKITGQQLFSGAGGRGTNIVPNPVPETAYNSPGIAGGKLTGIAKTTALNPSGLGSGSIKIGKTGKATLAASASPTSPAAKYQANLAKLQQSIKDGSLSSTQIFKTQQSLGKEAITSQYPQQVIDLYGMNAKTRQAYLDQNPSAANLLPLVHALDGALVKAGITPKSKLASEQLAITRKAAAGNRRAAAASKRLATTQMKIGNLQLPKAPKAVKIPRAPKVKLAKTPTLKGIKVAGVPRTSKKLTLTA